MIINVQIFKTFANEYDHLNKINDISVNKFAVFYENDIYFDFLNSVKESYSPRKQI